MQDLSLREVDPMGLVEDCRALGCTCKFGERPLGRLYGVSMGKGMVRLTTAKDCPVHREHPFEGAGEKCARCSSPREAWIHEKYEKRKRR